MGPAGDWGSPPKAADRSAKGGQVRQRRVRLWRRIPVFNTMKTYIVYVLKSLNYNTRYIGQTFDVEKRLIEHNKGKCRYTKGRMPWLLLMTEEFSNRGEAIKRERFFKSGQGRKYLDEILKK